MSDGYVCIRACTKSILKTTTNSLCVCAHLANKADSDYLDVECILSNYFAKSACNLLSIEAYYILAYAR